MGILWAVLPIDDKMKAWLNRIGVEFPDAPSRFPTGREIKEVLAALSGFHVNVTENGIGARWQASIVSELGGDTGEWTLLNINQFSGDEQEQKLWFEKGSERLIVFLLKEFAQRSGPLVLIADAGGDPQVISGSAGAEKPTSHPPI